MESPSKRKSTENDGESEQSKRLRINTKHPISDLRSSKDEQMEIPLKTGIVWMELYMWHNNGPATGHALSGVNLSKGIFLQQSQHWENPETKRRYNILTAINE
jgi:hypothetical protein